MKPLIVFLLVLSSPLVNGAERVLECFCVSMSVFVHDQANEVKNSQDDPTCGGQGQQGSENANMLRIDLNQGYVWHNLGGEEPLTLTRVSASDEESYTYGLTSDEFKELMEQGMNKIGEAEEPSEMMKGMIQMVGSMSENMTMSLSGEITQKDSTSYERKETIHSTMDMGAMMKGIPLPEGQKIGVIETKATSIFDCTASI